MRGGLRGGMVVAALCAVMLPASACAADRQAMSTGAVTTASPRDSPPAAPSKTGSPAPGTVGPTSPPADAAVTISAVGDVIMGSTPILPPDDGRTLFSGVTDALAGDVVLANLDQALTEDGASSKCAPGASDCYAFRTPPGYAQLLRDAGFTVVNLANNHTHDFGEEGLQDTRAALEDQGLLTTGLPGQVSVQDVDGVRVAVVGFSPYRWTQSLLDIPAAQRLVRQADARADVVVVTIHAGAEGSDAGHVRPGTETFLGENRGDPMAFSRAVIDAGADAVIGAGPHVLRGMEWYRGRLIAYSLGNFLGYEVLSTAGPKGIGAILTVDLAPDGTWQGGRITGTRMTETSTEIDPEQHGVGLVQELSRADFGACGVQLSDTGGLGDPTC